MKRIGTCLQFTLLFFSENHGSLPLFDIDSQLSHYCDELPKKSWFVSHGLLGERTENGQFK